MVEGGTVDKITLTRMARASALATLPNVVRWRRVTSSSCTSSPTPPHGDASGSETTGKNQYPSASYAPTTTPPGTSSASTTALTYSHRVLRVRDALGTPRMPSPFVVATQRHAPGAFPAQLQALQAEGHWLPANCGGRLCTYTTYRQRVEVSADWTASEHQASSVTSVQRMPGADTQPGQRLGARGHLLVRPAQPVVRSTHVGGAGHSGSSRGPGEDPHPSPLPEGEGAGTVRGP